MTGWTLKGQWLNLLIFLSGIATLISAQVPDTWAAIPSLLTPKAVIGAVILAGGYARSINTERPRESFQERKGEPDAKKPPDTDPTPETAPLFKAEKDTQ